MKSEPRPFASLSSGLLARKGAARPAMRPQGFGQLGSGLEDLGWNDMGFEPPRPALASVPAGEDALLATRSNPALGLTPASPVHAVQDELVQRLASDGVEEVDETAEPIPADVPPLDQVLAAPVAAEAPEVAEAPIAPVQVKPAPVVKPAAPAAAPRSRASVGKSKAAFTLRLDQDRHLKLRLACAVSGISAQQLVTRALDELLATMPELDAMASSAPERQSSKG
nr:hypothetical protein [uncultured Sphingomonas sp.]